MKSKQFCASVLLAGVIGMVSPLAAHAVGGTLGGVGGGMAQGSVGGLAQGQAGGMLGGRADAAMPGSQPDSRLIGRSSAAAHQVATRSKQVSANRATAARNTAKHAGDAASERSESGRERISDSTGMFLAGASGRVAHVKDSAPDATPGSEQPDSPARPHLPSAMALELGGAARGESSFDGAASSAVTDGSFSGETAAWNAPSAAVAADASGEFQAGVRAEQPRRGNENAEAAPQQREAQHTR